MNKVYCVMEGETYPEGCPYGIFDTIEKAKEFIQSLHRPQDNLIFEFIVNGDGVGYDACFNYLGERQNEAALD